MSQELRTSQGFTFHLPRNWKAIPKEALDAVSETIDKAVPDTKAQRYDYGFQLSTAQKWFAYPYILVGVRRTGKMNEAESKFFKQLPLSSETKENRELKGVLDRHSAKIMDSLSAWISSGRIGEPVYDASSHILFIQSEARVKGVGAVRGLAASLLTHAVASKSQGSQRLGTSRFTLRFSKEL